MRGIITAVIISLLVIKPVYATEIYKAKATAYCLKGETATGTQVTEGRTVASKREWFGKTMIMYEDDGDGIIKPENYLGTYIVEDTGAEAIRKGWVVDVFISDYNRAIEYGSKDILFTLIDAEG